MEQKNNSTNIILFIIIALAVLFGWNYFFPPPKPPVEQTVNTQVTSTNDKPVSQPNMPVAQVETVKTVQPITVKTDNFIVTIDEATGNIHSLNLRQYHAEDNKNNLLPIFQDTAGHEYIAQSGLITAQDKYLLQGASFKSDKKSYDMTGDTLNVTLRASLSNGVKVDKTYTFKKGSYLIGIHYSVTNSSGVPIVISPMYRLLRGDYEPEGQGHFNYSYTGPVVYTPQEKFQKISFKDINKNDASYPHSTQTGWLGMIQHYFMATWILQPEGQASVCGANANIGCQIDLSHRSTDGLYSVAVRLPAQQVATGQTAVLAPMNLYVGPQAYNIISKVADNLTLVKDYGKVHIFASPLFWILSKLHTLVGNWGWAIILLVIIVKAVLYPLTAASYRSMAKMRAVAPRLQALKDQYGDDRLKMQQEMMNLYKKEKINPLGGCLPMLIQIPVFLGLYWALYNSVELSQAPWIGWITDLGQKDPYYILPIIMAGTMFLQTHLNPAPADPMQAKMMKIMPIAFSVMFFFFPAGLVLYYVVNNLLSIAQQWYINKQIDNEVKHHKI